MIQAQLKALKKVTKANFKSSAATRRADREALKLARREIDRRLNEMNNFRAQIERAEREYITRVEYEGKHVGLADLLEEGRQSNDKRFQALERLVWMASGAVTLAMIGLQFLKR